MDPALFSLNWFLCLFVDTLPVSTYLHIWDAFLFEGSKVNGMKGTCALWLWRQLFLVPKGGRHNGLGGTRHTDTTIISRDNKYKVLLFSLPYIILSLPRKLPRSLCWIYRVTFKVDNCYQVLFRYALAILKSIEGKIMRQNDYMSIFNTFRVEIEALSDVRSLTQVITLAKGVE